MTLPADPHSLPLSTAEDAVLARIEARWGLSTKLYTLDVGCGDGAFVNDLAERGHKAFGVEPLAEIQERVTYKNGRVLKGGAEALVFKDDSFDLVTFCHSLHHVPSDLLDQALDEALRVLKPAGELMVIEPVAVGAFHEVMQPVDDEEPLYDAVTKALSERSDLQRIEQSYFRGAPAYRSLKQLKAALLRANPERSKAPLSAWNELTKRFEHTPKSWLWGKRRLDTFTRVEVFGARA